MKKVKVKLTTGSTEAFFDRALSRAVALDHGESVVPSITINFEDPTELLSVLTVERLRLLQQAKAGSVRISDLATGLKRDLRAVSRDVMRLEKAGLLRTIYRTNPGHGKYKVVEPVAQEYNLTATL
jgi:predicted transcriptional regulator